MKYYTFFKSVQKNISYLNSINNMKKLFASFPILIILSLMIKTNISQIEKYTEMFPSLKNIGALLSAPVEEMEHFDINRKHNILLVAKEGSARVATTWREGRGSEDVTAAFTLEKDDALFVLAGEYYIVKGEGKVTLTVLD